jgi:hypothetical protein
MFCLTPPLLSVRAAHSCACVCLLNPHASGAARQVAVPRVLSAGRGARLPLVLACSCHVQFHTARSALCDMRRWTTTRRRCWR